MTEEHDLIKITLAIGLVVIIVGSFFILTEYEQKSTVTEQIADGIFLSAFSLALYIFFTAIYYGNPTRGMRGVKQFAELWYIIGTAGIFGIFVTSMILIFWMQLVETYGVWIYGIVVALVIVSQKKKEIEKISGKLRKKEPKKEKKKEKKKN